MNTRIHVDQNNNIHTQKLLYYVPTHKGYMHNIFV